MHRTTPKVFLIGETKIHQPGLQDYFEHIGTKWRPDAPSDAEALIEVMGRVCYRSWEPGMNPNVKKIREGNDKYLANIIKVKHESVLEHSVSNWIFADVSRVFTHEIIRHRVGTAYSQESLRFVRLEDLGMWLPEEIEHHKELKMLFEETFHSLGQLQIRMAELLRLDEMKSFHEKKQYTSAMRRLAPIGLSTTIGASFNFRSLRHIIEMRTDPGAETEIREVFSLVGKIAKAAWPNLFADFEKGEHGGWVSRSPKV